MTHYNQINTISFHEVLSGKTVFFKLYNDKNYKVEDYIIFQEHLNNLKTGKTIPVVIEDILSHSNVLNLKPDWIIIHFRRREKLINRQN